MDKRIQSQKSKRIVMKQCIKCHNYTDDYWHVYSVENFIGIVCEKCQFSLNKGQNEGNKYPYKMDNKPCANACNEE
jgi:hypothetical protein